jgi:hypothetical protein
MTSLKQIEANRRNSLKSTGPKTEAGKRKPWTMCLQAAHRHCLTLKEPWKLQASSSFGSPADRPRIRVSGTPPRARRGPQSHDEPRTLVMRGRRVHRRERRWPQGAATKTAPEEGLISCRPRVCWPFGPQLRNRIQFDPSDRQVSPKYASF